MPDFPLPQSEEEKKPAQKKGMTLFGSAKPQAPDLNAAMADMSATVNDIGRRLLMVEERVSNINKKTDVVEQNILSNFKKVNTEIKTSNSEINEIRKEILDIKDKILLIIKELKLTAKKEDFEVMRRYMDLWEPLKYVTQTEVEKVVRRIIQEGKL